MKPLPDGVVVCLRSGMPSEFDDNITGTCGRCGHGVFFRPHAPRSEKVCHVCFEQAVMSGELTHTLMGITATTWRELMAHRRAQVKPS